MKTIFFDVDTQNDFMNKDGALYVPDAESIKPNLQKLTTYAISKDIKIFGSVDRHFEEDAELKKNGGPFPNHCMDGLDGQLKIDETIFPLTLFIANSDRHLEDMEINFNIRKSRGIYFEKQHYDISTNPKFEKYMKLVKPDKVIIFGVAADICVHAAAMAFRKLGVETFVVSDATRAVDIPEGNASAKEKEMKDAGVKFITTEEVLKEKTLCYICGSECKLGPKLGGRDDIRCNNDKCGEYEISHTATGVLHGIKIEDEECYNRVCNKLMELIHNNYFANNMIDSYDIDKIKNGEII